MKAMVFMNYGSPEVLRLEEIRKPKPADNEVLVKVRATSVNYNNLFFLRGEPRIARLWTGISKPRIVILGNDIAGEVEAIGRRVEQFLPGDEVFGDISECGFGAFSQYVSVPEKALVLKPSNLSFEEAAAVPESALVAMQALYDRGRIQSGQQVMIVGASGGIGTFAVQIAKYFGAEVTGVCGTRNRELVRSIGADHVIDYTRDDLFREGRRYDLILAAAGYRSLFDYRRLLKPGGVYVCSGGALAQIFQSLLLGPIISMFGNRKMRGIQVKPNKDLDFMKELIEIGRVRPVIDRRYRLSEAAAALEYYGKGHARGKVVLTVEHDDIRPVAKRLRTVESVR